MRTLKLLIVALAVMLGAESVYAGETATLTKRRRGSTASILPGTGTVTSRKPRSMPMIMAFLSSRFGRTATGVRTA